MTEVNLPKGKVMILIGLIVIYASLGFLFKWMTDKGMIEEMEIEVDRSDIIVGSEIYFKSLEDAKSFVNSELEDRGHIILYLNYTNNSMQIHDSNTNSEAISYYLLWNAIDGDKSAFDSALDYMEDKMLHPKFGYLMWEIDREGNLTEGGSNIASDADLRVIKALVKAEDKWGDERYTQLIETLERGLEELALTEDLYLAPYGGLAGEDSTWTGDEVWLSYMDFQVVRELEERFGEPWGEVYMNMKNATLGAQIYNGLYNSMLTESRDFGNGIDGGGYSINSMWLMVRSADSGDQELIESARKSLEFYKEKYKVDGELYGSYGSQGDALSASDTPWAYALVGRAAILLNDEEFASAMIREMMRHQIDNRSSVLYGSFPEDYGTSIRVGQFTMQESILTLVKYKDMIQNNGNRL